MERTGSGRSDGWPERLRNARMRRFPTTWQAAKALAALDPHLPSVQELHRYWSHRWEPGRVRPNRTYRELIEQVLDAPGLFTGELVQPAPAEGAAAAATGVPALASDATSAALPAVPARPATPDGAVRPNNVVGAGYASRAELRREVGMAADDAAEHAAGSDAGFGERTVEQLQGEVLRQARGYNLRPLPEVFRDARRTRDLAAKLTERTRRPAQLADLYAIAGQACGLLATAAFDMGYWDAADRFAGSALTYGELAGHDSLRAWILGRQADLANWQGQPDDALNRLGAALTFAPRGAATMRLRSIEARARALMSDRDGAAAAIRAAEEAREVDGNDQLHDEIAGEFGFVPARQEFNAASTHVTLGDGPGAEQHAVRALEQYESLPVTDRAYYAEYGARVDLAAARVLRGDLSGARDALLPVFALAPGQRVAGVLGRLDQVRTLLAADIYRDSREARQLADDITDFTASTHPPHLPDDHPTGSTS